MEKDIVDNESIIYNDDEQPEVLKEDILEDQKIADEDELKKDGSTKVDDTIIVDDDETNYQDVCKDTKKEEVEHHIYEDDSKNMEKVCKINYQFTDCGNDADQEKPLKLAKENTQNPLDIEQNESKNHENTIIKPDGDADKIDSKEPNSFNNDNTEQRYVVELKDIHVQVKQVFYEAIRAYFGYWQTDRHSFLKLCNGFFSPLPIGTYIYLIFMKFSVACDSLLEHQLIFLYCVCFV